MSVIFSSTRAVGTGVPSRASSPLPAPHVKVVNGGAHAADELDFQGLMTAPRGARLFAEPLRAGSEAYGAMVSHRSGETPDSFIADLAVGTGCGRLKSGAPARGERVRKHSRLGQVEASDRTLPRGQVG